MAIGYGSAVPKGKTRKQLKTKRDRADAKGLNAWRDAAWKAQPGGDDIDQWGRCAECDRIVYRRRPFTHANIGQVHHIISRRHLATRTDPSNAEILCRGCHNARHGREF